MGDISEYRYIIFAASLVLITIFLISLIPIGFLVSYDEPDRQPAIPDYLYAENLVAWNDTYILSFENFTYYYDDAGSLIYYVDWGKEQFGHDMRLNMVNYTLTDEYLLWNEHGDYPWWGFGLHFNPWHYMEFINGDGVSRGTSLSKDELETDIGTGESAPYIIKCVDFYMSANIGYNTTEFSDITDAWNNNGIGLLFGIEWDQEGTAHDAWSLVAAIFNLQGELTGNTVIDYLIRIPLLAGGLYVAAILVMRALGAIFGGGA